jgi:hypothetical protein
MAQRCILPRGYLHFLFEVHDWSDYKRLVYAGTVYLESQALRFIVSVIHKYLINCQKLGCTCLV